MYLEKMNGVLLLQNIILVLFGCVRSYLNLHIYDSGLGAFGRR